MRTTTLACLMVLATGPACAAGIGLKPGLWETRLTSQVVDGKDTTAAVSGAAAQMQKMMANMPPEQRERMEAMMKQHGGPRIANDGSVKMCISPEMANRDRPIIDREGRCQPATVTRSGNVSKFEFQCATNGITTSGKGEATSDGDTIRTTVDMTTTKAGGETHVMHNESEMKFLGADCGDVQPVAPPKSPQ